MKRQYHSCDLEQLCNQQVRFAPREQKIQQIDRAEQLHSELKPEQMYSYEYICFRITDYRPDFNPQQTISGIHAGHDLRLFIEDVSDAANLAVTDSVEPVHTVDDLSRKFHVATKTISRWRQQGLVVAAFCLASESVWGSCPVVSNVLLPSIRNACSVAASSASSAMRNVARCWYEPGVSRSREPAHHK